MVAALLAGPLAASVAAPTPAAAAAAAFSPTRTLTSMVPPDTGSARALLVLGNGALMVGGTTGGDFALLRPTSSGIPDQTFGGDGWVSTDFGGRTDVLNALARSPGGAVVAAGSSGGDVAVARYDDYGDLDRGFGIEGRVLVDLGADDAAYGVVVQPGGPVVVAGGNAALTLVLRYRADGTPDPGFGTAGRLTLPWGRPARALLAQPDGKLLVVGSGGASVDVARLAVDGTLDPTFGTGGTVRLATGAGTAANAAALLDDGRILVAGGRGGDVLLARLLPTGEPDPSFGAQGLVSSNRGRTETANSVVVGEDGRIRVVGEATDGTGFAGTYLPSGARDPDDAGPAQPPLYAVALAPTSVGYQAVPVVAGTSQGRMYTGGYHSYGFGGAIDLSLKVQQAHAAALQPDGRIVVAGEASGAIGLARYTAAGALDPSFGVGGRVLSDLAWFPRAVAVQAGGRILVAGNHRDFAAVVAFRPDGSVDPTFGSAGRALVDPGASERPMMLHVLADGAVLVGGQESTGSFLARFSAAGVPDAGFGTGGLIRNAFPNYSNWEGGTASVRQPDGRILVTGLRGSVSRIGADGRLDPTFGDGGTVELPWPEYPFSDGPISIALQPDGRILLGGRVGSGGGVARLNPDGSRDTTWNLTTVYFPPPPLTGYRMGEPGKLFLQPDGRVLMVGDQVAARLRADGTLDETYGKNGAMLLQHGVDGMVDGWFRADGSLVTVGSGGYYDPTKGYVLAVNAIPQVGRFHPLAPARILDTRTDYRAGYRVAPGGVSQVRVLGRGGVPAEGVTAVVVNLTVADPTSATYVTVWPANGHPLNAAYRPHVSNINVAAGQTRANLVTVSLGPDGYLNMYNADGEVSLILDVAGWYGDGTETGGARFHAVSPARLLDTRAGNGAPAARVGPGSTIHLQITGRGGVPATGVSAVVMNLTAVNASSPTYVTAWPAGRARPLASNLNLGAGQTAPNLVTVAMGTGGKVSLFNAGGTVDLVADVAGWYGDGTAAAGPRFHPVEPRRILDTRIELYGVPAAVVGPGETREVQVTGRGGIPVQDVAAVAMNVTVTQPTAGAYLTVWPTGQARPLASNLNFAPGQTVANLVVVPLGAGGRVSVYNPGGTAHVIADVAGWFDSYVEPPVSG